MRMDKMKVVMLSMTVAILAGCVVAIPLIINKNQGEGFVTVQFEVDGQAGDIYSKSVDYTLNKNPGMKVVKNDKSNMHFEGQTQRNGRTYDLKWTAKQLPESKTQFDFEAKGTEGDKTVDAAEMNNVADTAVQNFCDALNKKCQIAPAQK
jgi:hypothetical protein